MANPKWTPGVSGNPAGKPKGASHKTTMLVRDLFAQILEGEQENFKAALEHLRVTAPRDYVAVMIKMSAKFLPDLNVTAMTGLNGEAIQPLQIVLPNDPNRSRPIDGAAEEAELLPDPDSREPQD